MVFIYLFIYYFMSVLPPCARPPVPLPPRIFGSLLFIQGSSLFSKKGSSLLLLFFFFFETGIITSVIIILV